MKKRIILFSMCLAAMMLCGIVMTEGTTIYANEVGNSDVKNRESLNEHDSAGRETLNNPRSVEDAATTIASGVCGSNLNWNLDLNGKLFIDGIGQMDEYSSDNYAPWYQYRTQINEIKLADGVTSLGYGCFFQCSNVNTVNLPNTLQKIGDYAFQECSGINYITLPGSLLEIGNNAFYGCVNLGTINIPSNVKKIGAGAFASCTSLVSATINAEITDLNDYTFNSCTMLSSVTLPDSLKKIGTAVFDSCTHLSSISLPERLEKIGEGTFGNCAVLKTIVIPDTVYEIGDSAFGYCSNLRNVILPGKIKTLGQSIFGYCTSLEVIKIPETVQTVGMGVFMNCIALKEIEFSKEVMNIGSLALWKCEALENVSILNSNVNIGDYAFRDCSKLEKIYGYKNSTSEAVAKESGYEFIAYDDVKNYAVFLGKEKFLYDGKEKFSEVKITFDGKELKEGDDYAISYSNNMNVGTAIIDIEGKERYCFNLKQQYQIIPQNINALEITLSQDVYVYDGTEKKPKINLKFGEKILEEGKDYKVSYLNNLNAGNAKAVIEGQNNFDGSIERAYSISKNRPSLSAPSYTKTIGSKPFFVSIDTNSDGKVTYRTSNKKIITIDKNGNVKIKGYGKAYIIIQLSEATNYKAKSVKTSVNIVPQKVKINSSKFDKGTWKIKWKRNKSVTGYQIYLSENKKFKSSGKQDVMAKYIYGNTKNQFDFKVGKRKTYYMKIRAYKKVGKKKYYGAWSNVKRVKVR